MSTTDSNANATLDMPHAATSYTVGTITIIVMALSAFGNTMLLIIWTGKPKTRGHSVIFRYSLVACEIGCVFVCLLPLVLNYMARENLVGAVCEVQAYFYSMSFGICTWHVAFLVLNQYVWLSHQEFFAKYQTNCANVMQLFFCWTMPTILLIPGFRNTEVSYRSKRLKCVFSTDTVASVIVLDTLLSAALPGAITLISLILTFTFLRKQRSLVWSQNSVAAITPTEEYERRASSVAAVRVQKDEMPSVKTSALIFGRIIIAFTLNTAGNAAPNSVDANGLLVLDCIVYVFLLLDPLFYYATQERLRHALRDTLLCCAKDHSDDDVLPDASSESVPDLVSEVGVIRGRNRAFSMAAATHGVRPSFY